MSDERTMQRTRRARVMIVGNGEAMRELAALTRRRVANVTEVPTLFDAVDECRRASSAEPIAGIIISPDCEHFDAAAVADAFEREIVSVAVALVASAVDLERFARAMQIMADESGRHAHWLIQLPE